MNANTTPANTTPAGITFRMEILRDGQWINRGGRLTANGAAKVKKNIKAKDSVRFVPNND